MSKRLGVLVVLAAAAAALALVLAFARGSDQAGAADHLDGPLVAQNGALDINDVFVFHPPARHGGKWWHRYARHGKQPPPKMANGQDLSRTVLAMMVNPGSRRDQRYGVRSSRVVRLRDRHRRRRSS